MLLQRAKVRHRSCSLLEESSIHSSMMPKGIVVLHCVNMSVSLSLLASTSTAYFIGCLSALALAVGACWLSYLRGRSIGIGFRHARLDELSHAMQLHRSLWQVDSSVPIAEDGPDLCLLRFQQAGSRLVAVGEEADGRRRWFEGVVSGRRLVLYEVSRVTQGFHLAAILVRWDKSSDTLTGMRQVLLTDGSLQLQQIWLTRIDNEIVAASGDDAITAEEVELSTVSS